MTEVPTNGASAWAALEAITKREKASLEEEGIDDEDAIKLQAEGYKTEALLRVATREGLEKAGLKAAKVDYVMRIIATSAAQPGAAPPAAASTQVGRATTGLYQSQEIKDDLMTIAKLLATTTTTASTKFIMFPAELSPFIPAPLRTSIFVRPLYWPLLDAVMAADHKSGTVITGIPGIGKSAFAPLLMSRLAKMGCKVVYKFKSANTHVLVLMDFRNMDNVQVDMQAYSEELLQTWLASGAKSNDTWLLVDGRAPAGQHDGLVRTVVMSSPTFKNWSEYTKGSAPGRLTDELWVDVWSLPEIQECRAELHRDMTADEATARFISFGGSVRLVLADRNYTFAKLEQRVSPEHAEPLMHLRLAGLGDDISHKLVHIRADATFKYSYVQLASPEVIKMVARLTWQHQQHKVQQLMFGAASEPKLAGVIGMLFEQHGHMQMPAGLAVHMRKLMRPTEKRQAPPTTTTRHVRPKHSGVEPDHAGGNAGGNGGSDDGEVGRASDEDETCAISGEPLCDDNSRGEPTSHHYAGQTMHEGGGLDDPMQVGSAECSGAIQLAQQAQMWAGTLPSAEVVHLRKVDHKWDAPEVNIAAMENVYLQPPSANNPAFDAYYNGSGGVNGGEVKQRLLLQYTVSEHHGVRAQHIIKFLQRLSEPDRKLVTMVFVVPSVPAERYLQFSWQPWLGADGKVLKRMPKELQHMQQWVMALPLLQVKRRSNGGGGSGDGGASRGITA